LATPQWNNIKRVPIINLGSKFPNTNLKTSCISAYIPED
jgi:hypothetical protein